MTSLCGIEVDKFFGKNNVLNNANLDVERREIAVGLGPSDCGKSTLPRVIAGLEQPDSGIIKIIRGIESDVLPALRRIAAVFQAYAFYPHLSVSDNLRLPLDIAGLSQKEILSRNNEVSRILVVEDYLDWIAFDDLS